MTMQLTTHGNLYGLLLDDGVELVGDGNGMTLEACREWADKIENEHRATRSGATPPPNHNLLAVGWAGF